MSLSIPRRYLGVTDGQLHSLLTSAVAGELYLHAPVALRPERTTKWIGGSAGRRYSLDDMEKRRTFYNCMISNLGSSTL